MILALDKDGNLHLFSSADDVAASLEAIDIENDEYQFCDDDGHKLQARVTRSPSTFSPGEFCLEAIGQADMQHPLDFACRASAIAYGLADIKSLEKLISILEKKQKGTP